MATSPKGGSALAARLGACADDTPRHLPSVPEVPGMILGQFTTELPYRARRIRVQSLVLAHHARIVRAMAVPQADLALNPSDSETLVVALMAHGPG